MKNFDRTLGFGPVQENAAQEGSAKDLNVFLVFAKRMQLPEQMSTEIRAPLEVISPLVTGGAATPESATDSPARRDLCHTGVMFVTRRIVGHSKIPPDFSIILAPVWALNRGKC